MRNPLRLLFFGLILAGLSFGADADGPTIVRATGEARLTAEPDKAEFRLSVITYSENVEEAAASNAARTEGLLTALKSDLGPDAVVRTEGYQISPNRKYSKQGPEEVSGYSVRHTIFASTRDLDGLAEALDRATRNGADEINRIDFTLEDPTEFHNQALAEAVGKARAKADAIAKALGMRVARVISVDEEGGSNRPVRPYPVQRMAESMAVASPAPPIEAGEIEVQAQVTLAVELER